MNKDDKDITHWFAANEKKIIIVIVIFTVISGILSGKFAVDSLNNSISGLFKYILGPGLGLFVICIASGMFKSSPDDAFKKEDKEYQNCFVSVVIFMGFFLLLFIAGA